MRSDRHPKYRVSILWLLCVALIIVASCTTAPPTPPEQPIAKPASFAATHAQETPASQPSTAPSEPIDTALLKKIEDPREAPFAISAAQIDADVRFLADDARGGRGLGSAGLEASADYIAKRFKAAGLEPAGDAGSYFQTFSVVTGSVPESAAKQRLAFGKMKLPYNSAWRPFAFSRTGQVEAELVFAGYGISAPERGYDDYDGIDVAGKVVMVLRHEPEFQNPHGDWSRSKPSRWSDLRYKAHIARKKGALALLVVNDPATYGVQGSKDALRVFEGTSHADILAGHMTFSGAKPAMKVLRLDLKALQRQIDSSGRPASRDTQRKVAFKVSIARQTATVKNVVARINPSSDALDGAVVIGAHYDHLGFGGESSLRPDSGAVHNGADDNASGTALLMELAEALAAHEGPRRAVYAVAFTAEEIGLRGAEHFVQHPPEKDGAIVAMLNFDMVGRLRENTLYVSGVGTAPTFTSLADQAADGLGLTIAPNRDGYGPSDHSVFYARKIPVLAMFTGVHEQYHTPDDDTELVNVPGVVQIARYAYRVARYLTDANVRPIHRVMAVPHSSDSGGTGAGRGYGPYLGTIPSFGDTGGHGVKLQGVRNGSPAQAAGLEGGDTVIAFGEVPIGDLYDYTYALRERKAGDRVTITVMRNGMKVTVEAVLSKRSTHKSTSNHKEHSP